MVDLNEVFSTGDDALINVPAENIQAAYQKEIINYETLHRWAKLANSDIKSPWRYGLSKDSGIYRFDFAKIPRNPMTTPDQTYLDLSALCMNYLYEAGLVDVEDLEHWVGLQNSKGGARYRVDVGRVVLDPSQPAAPSRGSDPKPPIANSLGMVSDDELLKTSAAMITATYERGDVSVNHLRQWAWVQNKRGKTGNKWIVLNSELKPVNRDIVQKMLADDNFLLDWTYHYMNALCNAGLLDGGAIHLMERYARLNAEQGWQKLRLKSNNELELVESDDALKPGLGCAPKKFNPVAELGPPPKKAEPVYRVRVVCQNDRSFTYDEAVTKEEAHGIATALLLDKIFEFECEDGSVDFHLVDYVNVSNGESNE